MYIRARTISLHYCSRSRKLYTRDVVSNRNIRYVRKRAYVRSKSLGYECAISVQNDATITTVSCVLRDDDVARLQQLFAPIKIRAPAAHRTRREKGRRSVREKTWDKKKVHTYASQPHTKRVSTRMWRTYDVSFVILRHCAIGLCRVVWCAGHTHSMQPPPFHLALTICVSVVLSLFNECAMNDGGDRTTLVSLQAPNGTHVPYVRKRIAVLCSVGQL